MAIVSLRPFGETDVVSGFDSLDDYLVDTSNQGAAVGRVYEFERKQKDFLF